MCRAARRGRRAGGARTGRTGGPRRGAGDRPAHPKAGQVIGRTGADRAAPQLARAAGRGACGAAVLLPARRVAEQADSSQQDDGQRHDRKGAVAHRGCPRYGPAGRQVDDSPPTDAGGHDGDEAGQGHHRQEVHHPQRRASRDRPGRWPCPAGATDLNAEQPPTHRLAGHGLQHQVIQPRHRRKRRPPRRTQPDAEAPARCSYQASRGGNDQQHPARRARSISVAATRSPRTSSWPGVTGDGGEGEGGTIDAVLLPPSCNVPG